MPIIAVLFPQKFPMTFNGQARPESGKCGRGFDASLMRRQNFYYLFSELRFFDRSVTRRGGRRPDWPIDRRVSVA
jgi:hypothetical protein